MTTCPRCGHENAADARFCSSCGNSLVTRVSIQERRVVTALFADLARSTGMGESLDPEMVRGIVGRFFELAAREVAARGGTVEKFSGDAVMAVFGIPSAHEDDPERAVRTALAIRDAMPDGVGVRIGIESGEVVVGDPFGGATMATGDAMNVAARLEQSAEPGEVIVGPVVWEQIRDLVAADDLGEATLRGHDAAVGRWRVKSISADVGRPRGVPGHEAPMTGRDEELALLLDAAERAQRERKAVLFTIFGVPGLGKSRLVRETAARLADRGWHIVRGRCLPYGDGITYWPVAEMVRTLAGIDPDMAPDRALDLLGRASPDADVADKLARTVGLRAADETTPVADRDISYAFRRLLEHVGASTPLMLVFEDIHWAEPPLLDLIEYIATWTRDAPLLICCPSRPELVDTRPGWGSGRMEASRISLEPLTEEESRSLLGALLTVEDLPPALRQRVLDRAEGNPLFVEEVVRMLIEEGVVERRDGHWYATQEAANVRVPDSVEALIRARLDTLPPPERVVLQAASVVGRVFQRSAVVALAPPEQVPPPLELHLEDAILRDLITEERSPDEPTFRFRHILIRDVAYATLPKARRAELHTGVAGWLRAWAGSRLDEIVEIEAYHLEQAVRLRREVGGRVEPAEAEAAAAALLASAKKARARDDMRAVGTFAERGLAMEPSDIDRRLELKWLQLEATSARGEFVHARELGAALAQEAAAAGRPVIEGRALWSKAGADWITTKEAIIDAAIGDMQRAKELLAASGDWFYLTFVLEFIGYEGWWLGDFDRATPVWEEMAQVAREHNLPDREADALLHLGGIASMRGDVGTRRDLLYRAMELNKRGGSRSAQAITMRHLGSYTAMHESHEEGYRLLRAAAVMLDEVGETTEFSTAWMSAGDVRYREGKFEEALSHYGPALDAVPFHIGFRPEVQRRIASALLELGRVDEAAVVAEEAESGTGADDWATVASTGMVLGAVRAAQGRLAEADVLLRKAAEIVGRTDFPAAEEYARLGRFLIRTGRPAEGHEWLDKARAGIAGLPAEGPVRRWFEEFIAKAEAEAAVQG